MSDTLCAQLCMFVSRRRHPNEILVQSLHDRLYPPNSPHSSPSIFTFPPARNQLENTGNFPDFTDVHDVSYWECVYFLMVTMSTVGFGDIVCTTDLGRIAIVCFLLFGLVSGRGRRRSRMSISECAPPRPN